MKILVTGGLGFIGSNFIRHILKNKNIQVVNLDAEFFGSSHHNLDDMENSGNYKFVKGNILDRTIIRKALKNINYVFHLAAVSDITKVKKIPLRTIEINILGTTCLLEEVSLGVAVLSSLNV